MDDGQRGEDGIRRVGALQGKLWEDGGGFFYEENRAQRIVYTKNTEDKNSVEVCVYIVETAALNRVSSMSVHYIT